MGRLADALKSHRKNLVLCKEGENALIRLQAKKALSDDFEDMVKSIDDNFDSEDEKAWKWLKDNE